jgi:hypothetical protein
MEENLSPDIRFMVGWVTELCLHHLLSEAMQTQVSVLDAANLPFFNVRFPGVAKRFTLQVESL